MIKKQFLLIILGGFWACQQSHSPAPIHAIPGLIMPVSLQPDTTILWMQDFVPEVDKIDSLDIPGGLRSSWSPDKQLLTLVVEQDIPPLLDLKLWIKGQAASILLKRSRKIRHTLVFDPAGNSYRSVSVAGSLNDWDPARTPMRLIDGKWQAMLELNPGAYQYQLVVDGTWMLDPGNPDSVDNNIGGFNSSLVLSAGSEDKAPRLFTSSAAGQTIILGQELTAEAIFAFWNNSRLNVRISPEKGISLDIPAAAKQIGRSFIRVFAHNSHGFGNDLLIPLENGQAIRDPSTLTRHDKASAILYFLLIDRFHNGDKTLDDPVQDPEVHEKANYWGGDLAGITQKIEEGFFRELGINTIWVSPLTQNPLKAYTEFPAPHRKYSGYHGYWPISSSRVDHRFGSNQDLLTLTRTAHDQDLNLILDFVANHVHEDHPIFRRHPEWATTLDLPDGRKNIRIWEEERLTTWFDTFLPSLDFSRPEVIETQVDSALFWIKHFGLDGFRHDATKHIPETFWRALTLKLKKEVIVTENRPVFQIGETFGSRELIGSYVGSGQMDGQFDFNLYFDARTAFASDNSTFPDLARSLRESLDWYGYHHLMGNITGNHDIPRFISFAGGGMTFAEDDKKAGWNRDIQVVDEAGYAKLSALTAFMLTIPGVPVIYYGDEFGMPGAGDPDNRRPMQFGDLKPMENKTRETARKLIRIRKENMALLYGDFEWIRMRPLSMVYCRTYFDRICVVAFNKSPEPMPVEFLLPARFAGSPLTAQFGTESTINEGSVNLTLPAYGFEILTSR